MKLVTQDLVFLALTLLLEIKSTYTTEARPVIQIIAKRMKRTMCSLKFGDPMDSLDLLTLKRWTAIIAVMSCSISR